MSFTSAVSPANDPGLPAPLPDPKQPPLGMLPLRGPADDPRLLTAGNVIPAGAYADQPYVVKTADGAWLCVITTGAGSEGAPGQHIVAQRSLDRGKTWSMPVAIEPADGPEASWGVLLAAPSGRVFVFYVYNADNLRELPADNPPFPTGRTRRMDSQGYYVFRWSDDHGRTWSPQRVVLPVREFEIDRKNSTGGRVRLFWNVGRPVVSGKTVFLSLHKVRGFGSGWFNENEGAFLRSEDLLTLADPALAHWETLPDGDTGLRAPEGCGPIAEEQSLLELSDNSLFVTYRSSCGYPLGSYSRDRGHTWQEPRFLTYADGRPLKHPRAACFAWRLRNTRSYILWFHNHGGEVLKRHPRHREISFDGRNPVWMCRGWEVTTEDGLEVVWSSPEIVLYDDDPLVRISYPDLCQEDDDLYFTETQKTVARVHRLDLKLVLALRQGASAFDAQQLRAEAVLTWPTDLSSVLPLPVMPALPEFVVKWPREAGGQSDQRAGVTLELEIDCTGLELTTCLIEAWDCSYGGLRLNYLSGGALELCMSDGRSQVSWCSDPGLLLGAEKRHHIIVRVDGGPKIISFIVDGVLCDGGADRQYGWGRYTRDFLQLPAGVPFQLSRAGKASLRRFLIYPRAFLTAEAEALADLSLKGAGV